MFGVVATETRGLWTVNAHRLERRTESTTDSHDFYLHTAKILHTIKTLRDTLTGTSPQSTVNRY